MQQKNLRLHGAGAAGFETAAGVEITSHLADCDFFGLKIRENILDKKWYNISGLELRPQRFWHILKTLQPYCRVSDWSH